MKWPLLAGFTATLLSCAAINEPDFYGMSEAELAEYNRSLAGSEQVTCIAIPAEANEAGIRVCGTLEEISKALEPAAPGARQNTTTDFTRVTRSRSTNPAQIPTTRPIVRR